MTASRRGVIPVLALILAIVAVYGGRAAEGQDPKGNQQNQAADPYEKWLDEDVYWIIKPEERAAFLSLHTDKERDRFIEEFWRRRDPTPDTAKNEFKEEHYRRLAYANMHFASRTPGWKTDRGRTYITLGPPDAITESASGTRRTQVWLYRYLEGIGENVEFKFVDVCDCGDYRGQSVRVKGSGNSP